MIAYRGLDLFVGAGPSPERCVAVIGGALDLEAARFVPADAFDALLEVIAKAAAGWVVCHRTERNDYPHRYDVNMIDGRSPIAVVPDIARRLGVPVVVPDDGSVDPCAGLRFGPDGTVEPFSLLMFDEEG